MTTKKCRERGIQRNEWGKFIFDYGRDALLVVTGTIKKRIGANWFADIEVEFFSNGFSFLIQILGKVINDVKVGARIGVFEAKGEYKKLLIQRRAHSCFR